MLFRKYIQASIVIFAMPVSVTAGDWTEILFSNLANCFPSPQRLLFDADKREFFSENLPVDINKYINPKRAKINPQCSQEILANLATFETRGTFLGNVYRAIRMPVYDHCDCFTCAAYIINFEDSAEAVKARIFSRTGEILKISPDEEIESYEPSLDENGEDTDLEVSAFIYREGNKSSFVCNLTW
ncbi:hypothetical protein [Rhizobium ruizarguesonis]|uniref:Uncharacterized protein n=1 Tax=Rhizobium ruizarguesonis TaxID=2081791 RepID=A0AAE8Q577_9HYPH|nr:hypothetical protein [Rhizobium ruizarguesonis]TBC12645.1 hypothetical protein ELH35_38285 [Rhizobium ruizarguesonis]TBF02139.1 hypothetical protein ELG94_35005 [Rhizobium ruizarguesonis]TCA32570.1 hypothetical protein E0H66_22845 [Rhizobium leguminosarum bv. viciae]